MKLETFRMLYDGVTCPHCNLIIPLLAVNNYHTCKGIDYVIDKNGNMETDQ